MYLAMLLLDETSAVRVRGLWRILAEQGLPTLNDRWEPHITLAAFDLSDANAKLRLLRDVSSVSRNVAGFELRFEALGVFPQSGVLHTPPTPNVGMLELQAKLYQALIPYAYFSKPFYAPGLWSPHCSLSVGASPRELLRGAELVVRTWQPFSATARGLTLVRMSDSGRYEVGQDVLYRSFHSVTGGKPFKLGPVVV